MDYELPGQRERKPVKFGLVSDDSSDDEDGLGGTLRRQRKSPTKRTSAGAKAAAPEEPACAQPRSKRAKAVASGSPQVIDLDGDERKPRQGAPPPRGRRSVPEDSEDEDNIVLNADELEDPEARERRLKLERSRKMLTEAAAIDLDDEPAPEPDAVVEEEEDFMLLRRRAEPPPAAPAPPAPRRTEQRTIRFAVRVGQGEPSMVKTYYDATFEKLIAKMCQIHGFDPKMAKLRFDGDVVKPTHTPAQLDLDEDDQLDFAAR